MDKYYGFIYLTIDLKNGKGYVGQHKIKDQETLDTWYIGSGKRIRDILKVNGNDKSRFHRQILCLCKSKEELDKMEIYYIDYFDATKNENFYNFAEGGTGGDTFSNLSDEDKKKSIEKRKNTINNKSVEEKEEFSKKMSEAISGEKNGMYGKHHSEESNKKNSESNKETWKNKTVEEKEEFSKKMSEVTTGENNGMYGKGYLVSGENNGRVKSVYSPELDIIFSYVKLAEKYCINILNSKIGPIRDVCNKKRNYTGKLQNGTKLTWNWLEDVDEETLKNAIYISDEKYNELLSKM